MVNKGSSLVLASQFIAVVVHSLVKSLMTGSKLEAQQVLQARFLISLTINTVILRTRNPDSLPLGSKETRGLLVLRAAGGVCGAAGFYYSLAYLPLADATTLNLLAPLGASIVTCFITNKSFTAIQLTAVAVSFIGISLVTKPEFIIQTFSYGSVTSLTSKNQLSRQKSVDVRKGFGFGALGVIGGIFSYTTIARIGPRAHPLVISNCFSAGMLLVSSLCFALVPGIAFNFRLGLQQWLLLAMIGVSSALMEYLLTAGLAVEERGYAVHMVYSQVVLALIAEGLVWHIAPDITSCVGAVLVILGLFFVTETEKKINKQTSIV